MAILKNHLTFQPQLSMKTKLFTIISITILLAIAIFAQTAFAADDIKVFINGKLISFDVPPAKINGRTMVPLRGIFEGLGAEVKWEGATRTITAKRAGTDVKLTLGDKNAYLNGSLKVLDVPPAKVSGRTMVPLRFVGEAFGAEVKWVGATKSIYINDETASAPKPQPTATSDASQPSGNVVEGTVVSLDWKTTPHKIQIKKGNGVFTYQVTPSTAIKMTEIGGTFAGSISIRQIKKGDEAKVTPDPSNSAVAKNIDVSYKKIKGIISAYGSNRAVLKDGKVVALNPNVEIYMRRKKVAASELQPGREAYFRLNPKTNESWWVMLRGQSSSSTKPGEAQISSISYPYNKNFEGGDVISFTLRGTSGGKVTFSIPGVGSGVLLERSPGYYQGTYTVKKNDKSNMVYPIFSLTKGGFRTKTIKGNNPIHINIPKPTETTSKSLKAPFISTPANNTTVPSSFTVMGKGSSGTIVYITVQHLSGEGPVVAQLTTVNRMVKTDSQGKFSAKFSFAIAPEGSVYKIKVYQKAPGGEASPVTMVTVKQR